MKKQTDSRKTGHKLGSLFDGSGGFPLAGALCGIEPVWAAEVEPYPIAVTRSRFPKMKHLGDICKVSGAEIEPVDIITFGSPCQDLSVAGKRAGLKHEVNGDEETTRSGLFMEAVRIIKEMRKATNGKYPRFALWENVPGAFSSNKGEDFRIVCEKLIKIVEPSATMPPVPKGGWNYADHYRGDGWSLAYRVLDAQYWGVAQRRRRIYLVADLRGECAREVLFEREGLRGYFAEGRTPWQETPADAQGSTGADDREGDAARGRDRGLDAITFEPGITRREGGHIYEGVSGTLRAEPGDNRMGVVYDSHFLFENHGQDSRYKGPLDICPMLSAQLGTGENNQPLVMTPFCRSARGKFKGDAETWKDAKVANTLNTFDQGEARANELVVEGAIPVHDQATRFSGKRGDKTDGKGNGLGVGEVGDPMNTLTSGDRHAVAYGLDRASFNQGQNAKFDFSVLEEQQPTLTAKGPGAVGFPTYQKITGPLMANSHPGSYTGQDAFSDMLVAGENASTNYIVRRLTPTECARLQGFADWWGVVEQKKELTEEEYHFWLEARNTHAAINGKKVQDYSPKQILTWYNKLWKDSAEYEMWGNGIALPTALYCLQGVAEAISKEVEWSLLGKCPITPEQFDTIYNDDTEEDEEDWML